MDLRFKKPEIIRKHLSQSSYELVLSLGFFILLADLIYHISLSRFLFPITFNR
jgi:hypothetical protein